MNKNFIDFPAFSYNITKGLKMNRTEFASGLKRHFQFDKSADVPAYADMFHWQKTGEYILDLTKFDYFLHRTFGNYENNNLNMKELIDRKFGTDASKWCL